jgi:hypothetical protein
MPTAAKSSFGTFLKIGDGATTETFTTIAEVGDIKGPNIESSTEDVTSHSSTAAWVEKIVTLLEAGDVSFDINWLPAHATHSHSAGLLRDQVNKTLRNFQLVVPAAATLTWTFAAFVTRFNPDLKVKGAQRASIRLEISGQPTLA